MALLRVRLRGKTVCEVNLSEDRSYVAGRKEDCDIVLQPEKGISREHFKVSFVNGSWTVEVVSRYGEVIYNGDQVQQFSLEHGSQFSVPPYEFDFLNTVAEVPAYEEQPAASTGENLPALTGVHAESFEGSDEKTMIGVAPTAAFIKIVDSHNEAKEMIRLDAGDSWVAGRDPSCHIQIRDQRVSRRQFEIRRAGSQYVILDLGSVNGTLLNGNPISSTDMTPIKSGDAISVLENYLYFELHDASFQSRMELVSVAPPNPLVPTSQESLPMEYQQQSYEMAPYQGAMPPMPYQQPMQYPGMGAPAPQHYPQAASGKFDFQKHRPKMIIGAVVLVAVAYLFSGNDGKAPPAQPGQGLVVPGSPADIFAKLKPEQQALVRQRYKDAKNLYMQGKYQLAQDEIIKIQELVPDYEDIREIERLSKEAIFIQEQQRRQAEIEKSKIEAEEKIQKQVAECQKKINPMITAQEIEDCLSPVLQFNPEHPRILDLKAQVDALNAQREAKAAERAVYQSLVSKMKGLYDRAQAVHKKGKPLDAIAAYEKVIDAQLPDPNGYKGQSKRTIASIRQMMNSKTAHLQAEAEKYYQSQNLKGAIQSLRKARSLDPTNEELPERIERYVVELRKQMMTLYQEGILEESFGNVDGGEAKAGAKDKWKKILELDIPDGEYYKKAYIKLKKYGAL
ncbi:FHA domain-containing protein [Bdellovibrio bacteriovorus]|uniref:FHA domain-containing protein n=1 Tax=Bdellovibrio bacteriovorus TaxID=959 RepID=UPI0021CE5DE6|nr:FHA domain-containing protein [Bdellovibrio bacteriovorus]UXR64969.1 FHA domain-containing protein [Bdellovibrio bacteriovorus]